MATLQKIRNHGVILIVIVGLAMLAFILGDFLNSGSSFFNRSREYVGEIEGHKVHYTEYEAANEQLTEVYKIEWNRSDLDEDVTSQIRAQVWETMKLDWIIRAEAKRIGMDVTSDELFELCAGQRPHQYIMQRRAFMDENGQFSREYLLRFLASIEEDNEDNEQNANLQQARTYWNYWENAVRLTQMQDKFSSLMQNLVTANKLDAKYAFDARQTTVDVTYILKPYATIADSTIQVSDKDIKRLYDSRLKMYKQEPNRTIQYISFQVVPSEQDFADVQELMNSIRDEFYTTEDVATVVNMNSDLSYDGRNYSSTTIPAMYQEFAFHKGAKAGDVSPLTYSEEDQTFRMARIVEAGYSVPDSVELKAIAAKEGQEDQELGWFPEEVLRRQNSAIADKAFAGKAGERFTVNMGMGEQTFEIMDIAPATPKAKVAILERKVTPSSKTYSTIYNSAKQFIVDNPTEEQFLASAEEQQMALQTAANLTINQDKVNQLRQSRQIVRWAFESKEGQVSDVFDCGTQYIVALLSEVRDGDYRPISDVEAGLRMLALNEKKAEMIKRDLSAATTMEEAAKIGGCDIQQAAGVSLSTGHFGNLNEPAAVGAAYATEAGQLSAPVEGNMGVFVIQPGQQTKMEGEFNAEMEKQNLNMYTSYMIGRMVMNQLNEEADITDNRHNFQ